MTWYFKKSINTSYKIPQSPVLGHFYIREKLTQKSLPHQIMRSSRPWCEITQEKRSCGVLKQGAQIYGHYHGACNSPGTVVYAKKSWFGIAFNLIFYAL
jgi:hypothetical protein